MMDTIRVFLSRIRTLSVFKNGRGGVPFSPSCTPVSVAENESVFLNMPKYPWKYLNKLFSLCQGSEYAWSSYMFDKLLKMPLVLNEPGFWTWNCCKWKSYADFQICLIMASYASIMPEYDSICANIPQYG